MSAPEFNQEQIQQEIERTRERLGETVEELAAKADVKARAQAKAADVKTQAQAKAADAKVKATELSGQVRRSPVVQRRWPLAVAVGVLVAGSVAVWRWRKK
jgi:preprotein translocase subunit SecF